MSKARSTQEPSTQTPGPPSSVNWKRIGVIALLLGALFIFLVPFNGIYLFYEPQWMKDEKCCNDAERIAVTIGGALAEFFSEPRNVHLPSLEELEQWSGSQLSIDKDRFSVKIAGSLEDITVTVRPNPEKCICPEGKVYTHHFP